jgi:hypothetical protein
MPNPTLRIVLCVAVLASLACSDPDPSSVATYASDGGLEDGALEQTSLASTAPGEPLSPVECRSTHWTNALVPGSTQPDPNCDHTVTDDEVAWNTVCSMDDLTSRDTATQACRGAWRTTDFPGTPSLYASRAVVTRTGVTWTLTSPASLYFPHGIWTPTAPSDVCNATRDTHLSRFRSRFPFSTVVSTRVVATGRVVMDRHPFRDGAGGANTTATFDCHVVSHFRTGLGSQLAQPRWVAPGRTRADAIAFLASDWAWTYQDNDRFTPVASAIPTRPRPVGATWTCSTCDDLSAGTAPTPPTGPGGATWTCSTCDDLLAAGTTPTPPTLPRSAPPAHACLVAEHARVPASDLTTRRAIANRALLSFEAHGHDFTPAQRAEVRAIRRADPSVLPAVPWASFGPTTCGPNAAIGSNGAPVGSAVPACTDARFRADSWRIQHCARLAASHVQPQLWGAQATGARAELHECLDAYAMLTDVEERGACDVRVHRTTVDAALGRILRRAMTRFDTEAASATAGSTVNRETMVAALGRLLRLLDDVLAAAGRHDEDRERMLLESWLGHSFARHEHVRGLRDYRITEMPDAGTPELVTQLAGGSFALEQDLIAAALQGSPERPYETVLTADDRRRARPALSGARLLAALGQGLAPLGRRLETLANAHDVACSFAACGPGTPTPSARAWGILAALDDAAELPASLQGVVVDGWEDGFTLLHDRRAFVVEAAREAVGASVYEPGDLTRLDPNELGRLPASFASTLSLARARWSSYAARGLFLGTGDVAYTSLDRDKRAQVLTLLGDQTNRAHASVASLRNQVSDLYGAVRNQSTNEATLEQLALRQERLVAELEDLEGQIQANYAAQGVSVDDQLAAIEDQLEGLQGVLASSFVAVPPPTGCTAVPGDAAACTLRVDASHARALESDQGAFRAGRTLQPHVAALTTAVEAGDHVVVQASGQYSPACALSRKAFSLASSGNGPSVIPSGAMVMGTALTTSGGYSLSATGSHYTATRHSASAGVHGEACIGGRFSIFGFDIGSAKACTSTSASTETSNGNESREAASFSSGLRLQTAPFPGAPVGALLAVTTVRAPGNPLHGRIVDVDVVDGATVIAPHVAADVHLVVNDLALCADDTSHALTVQVRHQRPVGSFARQLLKRFAAAIATIRDERADVTERGVVLANELSALRNAATVTAMSSFGSSDGAPIAVETYPPPLRVLFELLLDRELTWLERSAHLGRLRRERDARLGELLLVNAQIAAAERDELRLGSYAGWSVRHLHAVAEANDDEHARLARTLSHFVAPLLRTWYPTVRTSLATRGEVTRLLNLQPDERYDVVTTDLRTFASAVNAEIAVVEPLTLPASSPTPTPTWVAVSFPRPLNTMTESEIATGRNPDEEFTYRSGAVRVDEARAAAVWDALLNERPVTIALSPYDLYARETLTDGQFANARLHQLSCQNDASPVLRRMRVALAGPQLVSAPPSTLNAIVAPQQPILGFTPFGSPRETHSQTVLTIADSYPLGGTTVLNSWRSLTVPMERLESVDAISTLASASATPTIPVPVAGVSPLTPITFQRIAATYTHQGRPLPRFAGVHELVLVLELETQPAPTSHRVAHPACECIRDAVPPSPGAPACY